MKENGDQGSNGSRNTGRRVSRQRTAAALLLTYSKAMEDLAYALSVSVGSARIVEILQMAADLERMAAEIQEEIDDSDRPPDA